MFFIENLFTNPEYFFMVAGVVVFSVCCHEYAHARVALWQGDPTAADRGHLTLNPLRQMGVFSLIMLAMIGIAWGRVPVNPRRMKHKYSDALVSFAGPAMNILLFFAFCILLALAVLLKVKDSAGYLFRIGAMFNFVLFVFNMLPAPGFDGWWVVAHFFPGIKDGRSEFVKGTSLLVIVLAIAFIQYLFLAGAYSTAYIAHWILKLFQMTGVFAG